MYLKSEISLEVTPQGTLAERMRAHASGILAIFIPTSTHNAMEMDDVPES